MNDTISRKAAIDALDRIGSLDTEADKKYARSVFEALPSAQPERESGEWIIADTQNEEDVQNGNYRYICSCCGYSDTHSKAVRVPYCWHCGAKMDEVSG
jgi:hypothetical protein